MRCAMGADDDASEADHAAIGIERAHLPRIGSSNVFPIPSRRRIHLLRNQAENRVTGSVPGGIAGTSAAIFVRLTPTVFRGTERMVARHAR